MKIRLHRLELDDLKSLRSDPTSVAGSAIVEGALPPEFVIDYVVKALTAGGPALWRTLFLFIDETTHEACGSGMFKGPPNDGRVELGYGVAASRRGQGVATQGVISMVRTAFSKPGVRLVIAETVKDNSASQCVLAKTGFRRIYDRVTAEDGLVDVWRVTREEANSACDRFEHVTAESRTIKATAVDVPTRLSGGESK